MVKQSAKKHAIKAHKKMKQLAHLAKYVPMGMALGMRMGIFPGLVAGAQQDNSRTKKGATSNIFNVLLF